MQTLKQINDFNDLNEMEINEMEGFYLKSSFENYLNQTQERLNNYSKKALNDAFIKSELKKLCVAMIKNTNDTTLKMDFQIKLLAILECEEEINNKKD